MALNENNTLRQQGLNVFGLKDSIELPDGTVASRKIGTEGFESGFGDFTEQVGSTHISRTTNQSNSGSFSVNFADSQGDKQLISDTSSNDAPTEGAIETAWYWESGTNTRMGALVRWQDSQNYYLLVADMDDGNPIKLWKVENGGVSKLGESGSNIGQDTWQDVRFKWWEDGGTFYYRFEYDDGTAYQQVGSDLSDSSPSFTGGGGIGFGDVSGTQGIATVNYWIDDTRLYW